jgi:hypothetical protein
VATAGTDPFLAAAVDDQQIRLANRGYSFAAIFPAGESCDPSMAA